MSSRRIRSITVMGTRWDFWHRSAKNQQNCVPQKSLGTSNVCVISIHRVRPRLCQQASCSRKGNRFKKLTKTFHRIGIIIPVTADNKVCSYTRGTYLTHVRSSLWISIIIIIITIIARTPYQLIITTSPLLLTFGYCLLWRGFTSGGWGVGVI